MKKQAHPSWDDPVLQVPGEPKWRARYRLLQSWHRETVLAAPPGMYRGRLRGNHLQADWLARHCEANFLTPEVAQYVKQRVPDVIESGGTIDETRLRSNLLSSMPLCFNLFGHLRAHKKDAARPLAAALDLDMAVIDVIEIEWSPCPARHLRDRTALDAYVEYRTQDGRRGFVGVETKYTESFSPREYDSPIYREITGSPRSGFVPGAADVLKGRVTNQLWRNAMLAVSLKRDQKFDEGHVAVVACLKDRSFHRAVRTFRGQLTDPPSLLRVASYEEIIDNAAGVAALRTWAEAFRRRYLDLAPVAGVPLSGQRPGQRLRR